MTQVQTVRKHESEIELTSRSSAQSDAATA